MPNKKSKSTNVVNNKDNSAPAPAASANAKHADPPATMSPAVAAPAGLALPKDLAEDFRWKNARAKALIMSTLVPGTEPYKIAESHELATDIWKALEEKYAPVNQKSKAENGKGPDGLGSFRLDFLGDWVEGKPLDKYMDMYKADPNPVWKAKTTSTADVRQNGISHDAAAAPTSAQADPEGRNKQQGRDAITPLSQQDHQPQLQPLTAANPSLTTWRPNPVKHDSYLSEYQALSFAGGDVQRKKQIQLAATKVLMQKLPTRDLRFLWAILYGGENAPWPGSLSVVIPGVTTGTSRFRDENG
ncbi:hypothetical protein LTR10_014591 [Elasticomyces elasticus]|uniref:ASX DEUBAD domain-containing protein n=1 Tax=Exophiala sideris TaxID=1016849 RepID=A0ABR0JSW3_9EURO|nr:hypothetical protein LTR10_014591 [Elasticomyces elasticus]KAK5040570.1 hypothetical protein LTS07_001068 [Exophiala sideris]KAK5043006.1 hypothetical protein LTR13_000777 [Exophiala sideris]KAK5068948.1 hypothetical protein LTR69_001069 [Exophiala sideris]KAK5186544.1 hypothetical protein LTR44_001600 [Eurotiomycetes sp. CCFEE 6388]